MVAVPYRGELMAPDAIARAAADALASDPFYATISAPHAADPSARADVLNHYFACSIAAGEQFGRVVRHEQPAGVAVWTLPLAPSVQIIAQQRKHSALIRCLGADGMRLYDAIVAFMSDATAPWVDAKAWYLSIAAVVPDAQNAGVGRRLLAPTLSDADNAGVACYLETFTPRSRSFYARLGFDLRAEVHEPTTGTDYAIMVREPRSR
ncbi:MAG: GNAT family N-acetyltransferase [Proteobacteria bacterium]|nr:GNAT family N-acetyltransferase [Pseudomonadota bacterium]